MAFLTIASIVIFVIIFLFTTLWIQIRLFLSRETKVIDESTQIPGNVLVFVEENSVKPPPKVIVGRSDRPFAMMAGIPTAPTMLISSSMLSSFSEEELEYVLLHELGHYEHSHTIKEFLYTTVLGLFGIAIISQISEPFLSISLAFAFGIILGVINIQLAKYSEYQADMYALKMIDDPGDMISATKKLLEAWEESRPIRNKYLLYLFSRSTPYEKRVEMAKEEIIRREKGS